MSFLVVGQLSLRCTVAFGSCLFCFEVARVAVKVGKRIRMLRWLRRNITMNAAETVWTCCGEQNNEGLEKLQRRAARTITTFVTSDEAMNNLRWDTLETRRDMHVFKLVNKCITGKSPQFFNK